MSITSDNCVTFHRFFNQIQIFCVYFAITFVAFLMRPSPKIPPADGGVLYPTTCPGDEEATTAPPTTRAPYICWGENCNSTVKGFVFDESWNATANETAPADKCYLSDYTDNPARFYFEMLSLMGAVLYIYVAYVEGSRIGFAMFIETWSKVPGRVMFMISCILIVASVPFRLFCQPRTDDHIIVMAMFLTSMHFLYFCRGFKSVGPFVIMIYKVTESLSCNRATICLRR